MLDKDCREIHQKSGWSREEIQKHPNNIPFLERNFANEFVNFKSENEKITSFKQESLILSRHFGLMFNGFFIPSDRGNQMETGQRSKSLRSLSTFFSDRSDHNDHMETGLNIHTRTCTRATHALTHAITHYTSSRMQGRRQYPHASARTYKYVQVH